MIRPYHEAASVPAAACGPRFGLLRHEHPATHGCRTPRRIAIFFRGINVGHLWRCRCGAVWRCIKTEYSFERPWENVTLANWTAAGGEP